MEKYTLTPKGATYGEIVGSDYCEAEGIGVRSPPRHGRMRRVTMASIHARIARLLAVEDSTGAATQPALTASTKGRTR